MVITIGREFGSGGRYIGSEVAKRLDIPFYDKELINRTYEKSGCNYGKLQQFDEKKQNTILKTLSSFQTNAYPDEAIIDDPYHNLMNNTIIDIANNESCVILGRNANNVLKNHQSVINIFIYASDLDFKVKRKMESENLSYNEALKKLKYVDKQRKKYYEYSNPNHIWGDKKEYDICIDSSKFGIEQTIDLIVSICKKTL